LTWFQYFRMAGIDQGIGPVVSAAHPWACSGVAPWRTAGSARTLRARSSCWMWASMKLNANRRAPKCAPSRVETQSS
jgi:hypothetical protein